MRMIKYFPLIILLPGGCSFIQAQQGAVTIDEALNLAEKNYPLLKKYDLLEKSSSFTLNNISSAFLPQLNISGSASYQSETINFSAAGSGQPGLNFPEISKDQYRAQAEISQQLYDGGQGKNRKEQLIAGKNIRKQQVTIALHQVRERVTDIYFSILLFQEQLSENNLRKSELQSMLNKAEAAYQNGTGFRSSVDELKASLVRVDMNSTELTAARISFLKMLGLFTGVLLDTTTLLTLPVDISVSGELNRPELKLFDLQRTAIDLQERRLGIELRPRLGAFVQAGYGRPTLNFIKNEFGGWWMAGIRLNWTFGSLYTIKNEREIFKINRQELETDRDVFIFTTNLDMVRSQEEIDKYRKLLEQDEEVIQLLGSVLNSARAQLDNGVITTHEYISKLNEENRARQNRIFHRIRLIQAYYNYRNTTGN